MDGRLQNQVAIITGASAGIGQASARALMREGASVVIHAKPDYYATRGSLSLVAREIRMVGLGELLARLERRRQLLAAEGLFAAELKKPLPFLPRTVGLITAPHSAAEHDE